jgi:predicted membrane chloride channel (bestrophin family)
MVYTSVASKQLSLKHQFGIQPNDLALDAISSMIKNTLSEIK